ncbi:MAG: adenosine deaminase [Flavobacteriia bacterium]|nr:adenosine deaminase [Flavobacteriia bacterium]
MKVLLFSIAISLNFFCFTQNKSEKKNYEVTSELFDEVTKKGQINEAFLNLFMIQMPKGGDIHHHYSGSIYAETYLEWVKENNWKIDSCSLKIVANNQKGNCSLLTVDQVLQNNILYRQLLSLWSDLDYHNHFHNELAPDQNFFNTFGYFSTASSSNIKKGLIKIKERAVKENVQYIETMLTIVNTSSVKILNKETIISQLRSAKSQDEVDRILSEIDQNYLAQENFQKSIKAYVAMVDSLHQGLDDSNFTIRFQTYCARVLDPLTVYTQLLSGFMVSSVSPLVVGVNIVAPENNYVSLQDYALHMKMFNYLNRKFPTVNRALHAGELTLGMVEPSDLQSHIYEAIKVAHAQRIGHGVDISYEQNSIELLKYMKKNNTAIEINLTSNEFILGVKGNQHPYLIYSKMGVPMVICTDDSGVSRNNLSNEYVLLASRYKISYKKIKELVYNSIRYAFLEESVKEELYRKLDAEFIIFEKEMAALEVYF